MSNLSLNIVSIMHRIKSTLKINILSLQTYRAQNKCRFCKNRMALFEILVYFKLRSLKVGIVEHVNNHSTWEVYNYPYIYV